MIPPTAMVTSAVSSALPPLYARWIDGLLAAPVPHETRATCDECAMCAPEGEAQESSADYFSPHVKCCSYQPKLPNYLVGRALDDRDFAFSAGRATLEKRVLAGVGVTPLGVGTARTYEVLYDIGRKAFGRSEALLCPHFLDEGGGRCGIWRHRNSVCTTWFCKFDRGAVGQAFWDRMRNLLMAVERSLAVWCALEAGLEADALAAIFPRDGRSGQREFLTLADLEGVPDPAVARTLWGAWLGREKEFFGLCGRLVEPLAWADVERIGGSEVTALARLTAMAFHELGSTELPERLISGKFEVISTSRKAVRVVAYAGSDPLDLDPTILEVLPYFDGRPTAEALRMIEKELRLRVKGDLLRKLADFGILKPPATSRPPHS